MSTYVRRADSALERIASVTGETANLAIATAEAVELLDQVDGQYLLGTRNWVGSSVPFHCSALGKVLLAFGAAALLALGAAGCGDDAGKLTMLARQNGMRNLREDGWMKVANGVTTAAEVTRVTQEF